MASVTAKRSLTNQIKERVKTGKCLLCDKLATRRGVCTGHYFKFVRAKGELNRTERMDFDIQMVREGKILGVGQIRELTTDNPYINQ